MSERRRRPPMSTDRDLNLRLGATLKAGSDAPFKNLSASAKQFGRDADDVLTKTSGGIDKLTGSLSKLIDGFRSVGSAGTKAFSDIAAGARQAEKAFSSVAAKQGASYSQIGQQNLRLTPQGPSAFRQAAGHIGGQVGSFGSGIAGMAGFGGLLAPATAALSAFTLAVKAATHANKLHYESLQKNPETGRAEENQAAKERLKGKERRESSFTRDLWGLAPHLFKRTGQYSGEEFYRRGGMGTKKEDYERYIQQGGPSQSWLQPEYDSPLAKFTRAFTPDSKLKKQQEARRQGMTFEQFKFSLGRSGEDIDFANFQARQAIEKARTESSHENTFVGRQGGLELDRARIRAQAEASLRMRTTDFQLQAGGAAARSAAILGSRGEFGYSREAKTEDLFRQ